MQISYKWKVVMVAVFGTLMEMIDMTIVVIALPRILTVFHENIDRVQLVSSVYLVATAITAPAAAFLARRYGVKRVYLFGQIGFLIGSMLCGISWNVYALIIFRVIQGLSGGLESPLGMSLIFTYVPPEERGTAMGIFGIPMVLAPILGTTLGGYLVQYWDWRMCFYVNLPVVTAASLLGLVWLKDTPHESGLPFDWKGLFLSALGFGTMLLAFTYAPAWGWTDAGILAFLGISVISLVLWVYVELHTETPMLNLRVFNFRCYQLGTAVSFATTLGLFSSMFLLPLFLQNLRGLGPFATGLLMIPQAVGSVFGMTIGGRIYDKAGARAPTIVGLLLVALFTFRLAGLDVTTSDAELRLILLARGFGLGAAMMPVMAYIQKDITGDLIPQASSLTNVMRSVFAGLGTAIFASLLSSFEKTNLAIMVQTMTPDSAHTLQLVSTIQVYLQQLGMTLDAARQLTIYFLYQMTALRAAVLAFQKAYVISAVIVMAAIIPALFLTGTIKKNGTVRPSVPID